MPAMNEHEIKRRFAELERELNRLRRLEEFQATTLQHLVHSVDKLSDAVIGIFRYLRKHLSPPSAPKLRATFTSGVSMNAVLVASLPSTRQDGTALDPTEIASISFQKTSLVGSPPVAGPPVVLQTNVASGSPAQLQPTDLTFTDTAAAPGDDYTCFVTDTLGHIGAASNDQVAPASQSPPSAPSLSATFS